MVNMKEAKSYNQEYSTQQDSHLKLTGYIISMKDMITKQCEVNDIL